jgi:hypothetical protein
MERRFAFSSDRSSISGLRHGASRVSIEKGVVLVNIDFREEEPDAIPSVYFSRSYGVANATHSHNQWRTVSDSAGRWQIPLEIRSTPPEQRDAVTPYGYGGIYADPLLTIEEIKDAWRDTKRILSEAGVIAVFLRFAPFLTVDFNRFSGLAGLELEHTSNTISVPLSDAATVWAGLRGRARTAIRKAQAQGFSGSVQLATATDLADVSPFRTLYSSTMNRVNASPSYLFGDQYYRTLIDADAETVFLAQVRDSTGDIVAASLVLLDADIAHYHLSGSDSEAARQGANNLLIWAIIEWAIERGLTAVHLGGGTRPGDNLFRFKDSFGGKHSEFWVGRAVIKVDEYSELVESHANASRCSTTELIRTGYFPAYRAVVNDSDE